MTKGRVKNRARIGGQNFAELPVLAEVWSGSLIWPLKEPPKIEWPSKKLKNVMTIFFFKKFRYISHLWREVCISLRMTMQEENEEEV